jgi:hypothetical protein
MKHSSDVRKKRLFLEACVGLLIAAAIVAAIVVSARQKLSATDVRIDTGDLRTLAASARLLASNDLAGKATDTFRTQQASLMLSNAMSIHRALDGSPPEPDIVLEHWKARHLARQLEDSLQRMSKPGADFAAEADICGRLASQLSGLEDGLKQRPEQE